MGICVDVFVGRVAASAGAINFIVVIVEYELYNAILYNPKYEPRIAGNKENLDAFNSTFYIV